ncbi:DUF2281 domain-containing protein [Bacteroidota bacterium]
MIASTIYSKINELPPSLKLEALKFIELLENKRKKKIKSESEFSFNWEGALKEFKKTFTSVELQHQVSEWR